MFKIKKLMRSFGNAFRGLGVAVKWEQSFRIQLAIAGVVVILMFVLPLSYIERAILIVAIGFVLGMELLNSQLERILDLIDINHNEKIKAIKDLSAAAVLIGVLTSSIVGFLIFLKHLF